LRADKYMSHLPAREKKGQNEKKNHTLILLFAKKCRNATKMYKAVT